MLAPGLTAAYAATAVGPVHYLECGSGRPLVLLHAAARTCAEFGGLMPRLAPHVRALACDLPGSGASAYLESHSIETYAAGVVGLLDDLGLERASLLGHHLGGVVAFEVAATIPERIERLVLSSTPFVDAEARALRRRGGPRTYRPRKPDGSHLLALWHSRVDCYPPGRIDLLDRFVSDALALGDQAELGHDAVAEYRMEERVGRYDGPLLYIFGAADPFAAAEVERSRAAFAPDRDVTIPAGTVALMEQCPDEVAAAVLEFLRA